MEKRGIDYLDYDIENIKDRKRLTRDKLNI